MMVNQPKGRKNVSQKIISNYPTTVLQLLHVAAVAGGMV